MKIKTDFVTNSSSTSYIIAVRHIDESDPKKVFGYGRMKEQLDDNFIQTRVINDEGMSTVEQLHYFMIEHYGWTSYNTEMSERIKAFIENEGDHWQKEYPKMMQAIGNGCTIYYHSIDYSDESWQHDKIGKDDTHAVYCLFEDG